MAHRLVGYQPGAAEHGVLYRVIDEHRETFLEVAAQRGVGVDLRAAARAVLIATPSADPVTPGSRSHIVMQQRTDTRSVTVPIPDHHELAVGTLLSIIRQSGISRAEFAE
jgi:hypothetical protein